MNPRSTAYLLLACVFLCFSLSPLRSQTGKEKNKYPEGYIVSLGGDTTWGYVRSGNYFRDQQRIRFYDDFGARTWYTSDRLGGYGYENKHYTSHPTPYFFAGIFSDSTFFLLRRIDGPAKLYRFYTRRSVFNLKKGPAFYEMIEKPDGKFFDVSLVYKFKRVAGAFEDYPELAEEIRSDLYKPEEMDKIIQAYNEWYLKQK